MYIELLRRRKRELEAIIEHAERQIAEAPEGKLRVSSSHGKAQFYLVNNDTGHLGEYLSCDQEGLISALSQKEYNKKVLELAKQQVRAIYNILENPRWGLSEHTIKDVQRSMHSQKRCRITPIEASDENYLRQWQDLEYQHKPIEENAPHFITEKGEAVRSKSELIIANTLSQKDIPYHYEKPVRLINNAVLHPDFMVLNTRTRTTYYWEHFGMMDDSNYCASALKRIELYEQSGIFFGQKLIVTFETHSRPLGTDAILRTIRAYLK